MTLIACPPVVAPSKKPPSKTAMVVSAILGVALVIAAIAAVITMTWLREQHMDHSWTRYWVTGEVQLIDGFGQRVANFTEERTLRGDDGSLETSVKQDGQYYTVTAKSNRDGYTYTYSSRTKQYATTCPTVLCHL